MPGMDRPAERYHYDDFRCLCDDCRAKMIAVGLTDANGVKIAVGQRYWDNNLDRVEITELCTSPPGREGDLNKDCYCAPWHDTRRISDGRRNTSDSGKWGRLATYHPVTGERA